MAEFTIFYSWQSDCHQKFNRYLIRDALEQAIKTLRSDPELKDLPQPTLDHDTLDAPGTPNVTETILEKIERCGIFLADVSFVAEIKPMDGGRPPKPSPNPNVMLELGYAASKVSWKRVVLVMNTAYGDPESMIFDLGHRRHPIQFHMDAAKHDERSEVVKSLGKNLIHAIKVIMKSGVIEQTTTGNGSRKTGQESKREKSAQDAVEFRDAFIGALRERQFHELDTKPGCIASIVIPKRILEDPIPIAEHRQLIRSWLRPLMSSGPDDYRQRAKSAITTSVTIEDQYHLHEHAGISCIAEFSSNGVIRSASKLIAFQDTQAALSRNMFYIPSQWFEDEALQAISSHINLLDRIGISGPYFVNLFMIDLPKVYLHLSERYFQNSGIFYERDIFPDFIEIPDALTAQDKQTLGKAIKQILDHIWQEFGFKRSLNYNENGEWVGQRS